MNFNKESDFINKIVQYPSNITNFVKDKKIYTSAKIGKVFEKHKVVAITANAFIDLVPVIGLTKNTPIFIKSLKTEEWKTEIYKFSAVLGCTPLELMAAYSKFVSHDLSSTATYYTLSKLIYRSLYMSYIYKKQNIDINKLSKKALHDLEFGARIYIATTSDKLDQYLVNNDNITTIYQDINKFIKKFNLKKKL